MTSRAVFAIALAAALGPGCVSVRHFIAARFDPPTVAFETLTVGPISLENATFTPVFKLHNPNGVGFALVALDYRLEVEGQFVGQGSQTQRIEVPANGDADVPLPLQVQFADLPVLIVALLGHNAIHYRVNGTANLDTPIGKLTVPLEHQDVLTFSGVDRGRPRSVLSNPLISLSASGGCAAGVRGRVTFCYTPGSNAATTPER